MRVWLSTGREGQGKSVPPQSTAGPPGPEPPGRPPAAVGGRHQGTSGPPTLPPPPAHGRTEVGARDSGPVAPRGGRGTRGEDIAAAASAAARQAPPVDPRTLPHYPLPTGNGRAAPREAQTKRPGEGGGADRGDEIPPPLLPHRPTGGRPGRAWRPRPLRNPDCTCMPQGGVPEGKVGRDGGHRPPHGAGGQGAAARPPLPPSPPRPPPACGPRGRRPSAPPGAGGASPPPTEGTATPGGGRSWIHTPRAPAPPTACPRGGRDRRGSSHQRARTTHGQRPGAAHNDKPGPA